ncbi:helix-turn-helix domain-containing protein [Solirubrobacter phytolaccae]|uniref:Helix-turn-helix domain-containing protein n=1 Tax=Solirubrobacter phytolaccae TaxID=1404360 RepID=A0A9X3NDZ6_9ACTN|nr:helix-turn-helix domain-containing protein [Solirubrobacter phytolaccae]MDA0184321.1 helix-turn-helix domain-containing protein [Solirubrobacter phytolaccae]
MANHHNSSIREELVRLDPESVRAVALAVADLLRAEDGTAPETLLTPSEVALRYGVSRAWVYAHARELGAVRLGAGPKARLRFHAERVEEALATNSTRGPAAKGRGTVPTNARRVAAEHAFDAGIDDLPDAWRDAACCAVRR